MAKRTNLRLVAMAILAVLFFSVSAFARLYDGNGTEAEPFIIDSAAKMNDIGNNQADWGSHFRLMADVDLGDYTGTAYNIIGPSWGNKFTGVFDGNDHTIANFTYTTTGISNIGLFGVVSGVNAEIKNLRLVDPNVDGGTGYYDGLVGAMIGYIDEGIVENCHVEGGSISGESTIGGLIGLNINATITNCSSQQCIVSGRQEIGGLIGFNKGTISDCTSSCTVSGEELIGGLVGGSERGEMTNCSSSGQVTGTDWGAGGLAGYDWKWFGGGITTNCHSSANVTGNRSVGGLIGSGWEETLTDSFATGNVIGIENVGGLVGEVDGPVQRCYATGNVEGTEKVGGLIGWSWVEEEISDCYSTGNVTGDTSVGGLVGLHQGEPIKECYSTSSVTGQEYVGGFVGYNKGYRRYGYDYFISNCYSTGSVEGSSSVGGFAGYHYDSEIINCYSVGPVSGISNVGGFLGLIKEPVDVTSSFWDVIASGQITSAGGMGKTTEEMQTEGTFTSVGWDFDTPIWVIYYEDSYPQLTWEELYPGPVVTEITPEPNILVMSSYINIDIKFNKEVFDVDVNDLMLSNTAAISAVIGQPVNLGDNIWRFPVTNLTDGILDVNLASDYGDIIDVNGFSLWPRPTQWDYEVFVLTPILETEPEVTLGIDNSIFWDLIAKADMYYIECSNEPNFSTMIDSSDWIYDTEFDFTGLDIGKTYWYRAMSKTTPELLTWEQTTHEDFATDKLKHVNIAKQPGNVILSGADLVEVHEVTGGQNSAGTAISFSIYNKYLCTKDFNLKRIKHYLRYYGDKTLQFVVYESLDQDGPYQRLHINSRKINGRDYTWYSSGDIDVQLRKGRYYLIGVGWSDDPYSFSVRYYAYQSTPSNTLTSWGQVVQCYRGSYPPAELPSLEEYPKVFSQMLSGYLITDYSPSGTIKSGPIHLPDKFKWKELSYNATVLQNTNLSVDILDSADNLIAATTDPYFDLNNITISPIKIRANLTSSDPETTPVLHDWQVKYEKIIESDWSNVVWSMQGTLGDAVDVMLDPNNLKNANMANALNNKIDEVMAMIDAGLYEDALEKLQKDILCKTDGCANNGEPDKNDWIETCEEQEQIYPLVVETIEYVESLME